MAAFFSDEWFEAVLVAARSLPEIDNLAFDFEVEVTESVSGTVRGHGRVDQGRLVAFEPGKLVLGEAGTGAEVKLAGKAKRLLPIIEGDTNPLVAYMLGELKVDGAYELVVDHFAGAVDRSALEAVREKVAASTD